MGGILGSTLGPVLAEEAKPAEMSKVHGYEGPRYLSAGRVEGEPALLEFEIPPNCYMFPARPRPPSLMGTERVPFTWIWQHASAANFHCIFGGRILFSVMARAPSEEMQDLADALIGDLGALAAATPVYEASPSLSLDESFTLRVRGLPADRRACVARRFKSTGDSQYVGQYLMVLIPFDEHLVLVWVGESEGGLLCRAVEKGLRVVPPGKRPRTSAPLALHCPMGEWELRCGLDVPKGYVSEFPPDLESAAAWRQPDPGRLSLTIHPAEDPTFESEFRAYHRGVLSEANPDAEVLERTTKVGRERYPLLLSESQRAGGAIRTAVFGIQDDRARISWRVEEPVSDRKSLAKWGEKSARTILSRFRYWYVESYERQMRQLGAGR